jgi:hypothetical protein
MVLFGVSTDKGAKWLSTIATGTEANQTWVGHSDDNGLTWHIDAKLSAEVQPPSPPTNTGQDHFGIKMIYATKQGGRVFNAPLDQGGNRTLRSGQRDGTTDLKPLGDATYTITPSAAEMKMAGNAPRAYVYDEARSKLFENVEITCYYKSVATTSGISTGYQGFEIGCRGEHELAGTHAKVYYSRHSLNGTWWRLKEDIHPTSNDVTIKTGVPFATNTWYGMKFVQRTDSKGNVRLESYRDTTDGKDGGNWEKMFEYTDSTANPWKGWPVYTPKNCGCHSSFIRTDNAADFRVKKWSIREIDPLP